MPQRWIFVAMGFLAFVNAYNMRVCLTTTIGEMVIATKETRRNSSDETCRNELGLRENDPVGISTSIRGEGVYDWNENTQVKKDFVRQLLQQVFNFLKDMMNYAIYYLEILPSDYYIVAEYILFF